VNEFIEIRGARKNNLRDVSGSGERRLDRRPGPDGGTRGGEVVFGTPAQLRDAQDSLTGEYLRRSERVAA
jgi:hypothetical protein